MHPVNSQKVGADSPALFYALIVSEISLWTLTKPVCICSCECLSGCIYICVFSTVTQVAEVEMASSRGCLFCGWLRLRKDHLTEMSEASAVPYKPPLFSVLGGFPLGSHWTEPTLTTNMSPDLVARSSRFHMELPGLTTVSLQYKKCILIMERGKKGSRLVEYHWIPGVFQLSKTFFLHCYYSLLWQLKICTTSVMWPVAKLEKAPRLLCALTQHWYFKHYFKMCVFVQTLFWEESIIIF